MIHNRLFRGITIYVGSLLIIDSLTWVLNGSMNPVAFFFNYFITICLFVLTLLPAYLWDNRPNLSVSVQVMRFIILRANEQGKVSRI